MEVTERGLRNLFRSSGDFVLFFSVVSWIVSIREIE